MRGTISQPTVEPSSASPRHLPTTGSSKTPQYLRLAAPLEAHPSSPSSAIPHTWLGPLRARRLPVALRSAALQFAPVDRRLDQVGAGLSWPRPQAAGRYSSKLANPPPAPFAPAVPAAGSPNPPLRPTYRR